jgi:hypothetical protein
MRSRREILKQFSTVVAGSAVLAGSAASTKAARAASMRAFASGGTSSAPWGLLAPIAPGHAVGRGWKVTDLSAVRAGASILTLTHRDGRTGRIHICAQQGKSAGVARTHLLDLVLMDGGDGDKRTDESLGRVIRSLAKRIARNELGTVDRATLEDMARMLPHTERMALFGPENLT